MNSNHIEVDLMREILVLPLRLEKFDSTAILSDFMRQDLLNKNSPWKEAANAEAVSLGVNASAQENYAERVYFHPFVQSFLYGEQCKHFVRKEALTQLQLKAKYNDDLGDYTIDLVVERCVLTIVPKPGLVLLTLEVTAKKDTKIARSKPEFFHSSGLTLADALSIHDVLRRIFPPYFVEVNKWNNALFPQSVSVRNKDGEFKLNSNLDEMCESALDTKIRNIWAPWWKEILGPVISCGLFTQVVDERIPSMMFVSTPHDKNVSESDRVRLCFADGPGTGSPYAPEFLENFERDHAYKRFSHFGTTYYSSAYSFVCLLNLTSNNFYIQTHFRRHYMRMFFIVQMQKAALLTFSAWMAGALNGDYQKTISQVRSSFVEFTHQTWFSNVSNQEQGRELFQLMQKSAGNLELYAEVKAESETAREELVIAAEQAQAQNGFILNIFATLFTVLAFPPTAWQVLVQAGYFKLILAKSMLWMFIGSFIVAFCAVLWMAQSSFASEVRIGPIRLTDFILFCLGVATLVCFIWSLHVP